ncbi:alpha/beta fold hydrolase, partial [Candidatus Falkowbacteria bacterium]|nr:alpha/beta fold hydrolase [Candidatus Falkowbacteria bacterium]
VISDKGDSAFWVKLKNEKEDPALEGKFFIPGGKSEKLIVFIPGLPGDGNTWMESKFVPSLLREGYSIFCGRHRGTKVNAEGSDTYVNCEERISKETNQPDAVLGQVPGKSEYSVIDIADEPRKAIGALHENFEEVYLIGHSNGAMSIISSLPKLPKETTDKIRTFISLSGYTSNYDPESDHYDPKGYFDSEGIKEYYDYCVKFLAMGDPAENARLKQTILNSNYESDFPENINLLMVNSPEDEILPVESAIQFRDYVERGVVFVDETETEEDFHDLNALTPQTLKRMLQIYHPKAKHTVPLTKK